MAYSANDPSFKKYRRQLRKSQTDAEDKLWVQLRNRRLDGFKFFRQYSYGPYILDFYCPQMRVAIEADGSQHVEAIEYDDKRSQYLRANGIHVMRFWDNEVLQSIDVVVEVIWQYLIKKRGK